MSDHKWDLSRLSAGDRSALKKNAGIMMYATGTRMEAIEAFYRALTQRCSSYAEEAWFAALCMQCLWREKDHPIIMPFPKMLQAIYQNPKATDSLRKRCTNYLDLFWNDDGFLLGKIYNLVRKMRADNASIMPDFESLADDLANWNRRYVQRHWLSIICMNNNEQETKEEDNTNVD